MIKLYKIIVCWAFWILVNLREKKQQQHHECVETCSGDLVPIPLTKTNFTLSLQHKGVKPWMKGLDNICSVNGLKWPVLAQMCLLFCISLETYIKTQVARRDAVNSSCWLIRVDEFHEGKMDPEYEKRLLRQQNGQYSPMSSVRT